MGEARGEHVDILEEDYETRTMDEWARPGFFGRFETSIGCRPNRGIIIL